MRLRILIALAAMLTGGVGSATAQSFLPTTTVYGAANSGEATVGGIATNGAIYEFKWMTVAISYKTYSTDSNGNVTYTVTTVYDSGQKAANPFTKLYPGVVGRNYDVTMQARFDANRQATPPYLIFDASFAYNAP